MVPANDSIYLVTALYSLAGDIRLNGLILAPHEVAAREQPEPSKIRFYETQSILENVLAGCHLHHSPGYWKSS